MQLTRQRGRPHYAWAILISAMVILAISNGVRFSFGVLIDPLVEAHGWSKGDISVAYTLQFLAGIPVVLAVGKLAERIGSQRIVIASVILFVIGMLLTATITKVWQFQLYFGVITGALGTAAFVTLLPVLLTRWFYRKVGLAVGLMWTSLSLGPMFISPLMRWAIEDIGWSMTFIIFGIIGGSLMLVSSFFMSDSPKLKKVAAYGQPNSKQESISGALKNTDRRGEPYSVNTEPSTAPLGFGQVAVMGSFWGLVAIHFLGCMGHSVPLAHVVSIATFAGVPGLAAAGILSILSATSLFSRFGASILADARGGKFTLSLVLLLQTLPILLLLGASELGRFYSFAFLFGIGFGGEMVGFPIFNRQYYGTRSPLNTIYSYQMAGAMLGMAAGGWLGGVLFDFSGSYTWSIVIAIMASFFGLIVALLLPSYHRQRSPVSH